MKHSSRLLIFVTILLFVAAGCNRYVSQNLGTTGSTTGTTGTTSTTSTTGTTGTTGSTTGTGTPASTLTFDCTQASCPQLQISGDSMATLPSGAASTFAGFADPSMRKDPTSNRIWMAYSWPHVNLPAGAKKAVAGVETHLAYSDDNGTTWKFQGQLWPSELMTDKGGNTGAGYLEHEVPNLLPVDINGTVTWYGVRLDYFNPENGGYGGRPPSSFQLRIMEASSPEGLANATGQVLGSMETAPGWGVNVNLAALSSSTKKCELWNEPALYYQSNLLYLSTRCLAFTGSQIDEPNSDDEIYSTSAQGPIANWQWKYVGNLTNSSVASTFGHPGTTELDLANGSDGKLLAIMSPEAYSSSVKDYVHYGCFAVEVASIDPPSLARDASGNLIVRAKITASDATSGTGGCTYDPSSNTGIIMPRLNKSSGDFLSTIDITKVRP